MAGEGKTKRWIPRFFADRVWYHPLALLRRLINYYLLVIVALFFLQNYLLFPRYLSGAVMSKEQGAAHATNAGLEQWSISPGSADFQGYVPRGFEKPAPRGTIVVFHGNAGCAFDRTYYADAFHRRGFRTFLYEYPGYGGRRGSPSAKSIVGDARALIRALDEKGLGPVYVWGESVGAGIAAEACADPTLPVHGLALLTPWDSLVNAAAYHYPIIPVGLLLTDKYDSIGNLREFRHPVCVIVSTKDTILPPKLGLHLYEQLNPPKKLILQEGYGHNDWPSSFIESWWDDALDFITPRK